MTGLGADTATRGFNCLPATFQESAPSHGADS